MKFTRTLLTLCVAGALAPVGAAAHAAPAPDADLPAETTRISVAADGSQVAEGGSRPTVSADGRYVAFMSSAPNLVAGETNAPNLIQAYVYDRLEKVTSRVSVAVDGGNPDQFVLNPTISADGRFVTYETSATNLVPDDTNNVADIFVYDREAHGTTRVSVASDGTQGNRRSQSPAISADGRYVAFGSFASKLVRGDTNGKSDVFLHDRTTKTTTRISVSATGTQPDQQTAEPAISGNGRYVAYSSAASTLVPDDTNGAADLFVYDSAMKTTKRITTANDTAELKDNYYYPSLSFTGRYISFDSIAPNIVRHDTNKTSDVFVYDQETATVVRASVTSDRGQAKGWSSGGRLSGDGRFVSYGSNAPNLVPGDTNGFRDSFVTDLQTGITKRVNVAANGSQANKPAGGGVVSGDGNWVVYATDAGNLVAHDTNHATDVFTAAAR